MKVYEYIDYIMSFFAKMNCKEGQGLFLLRTMDASVRRDGYTQETINILHKIVHILLCNDFISTDDRYYFFKLTEKGYQYTQGARDIPLNAFLYLVVDYSGDAHQLYNDIWLMIGKEETAPFYVKGPDFYNTIAPFLSMGVSYTEYMVERRNKDLSTTRAVWYKELITKLSKEDLENFANDLSAKIDKLIKDEIQKLIEKETFDFDFDKAASPAIVTPTKPASVVKSKKKVFISYTHEEDEHNQWVKQLAECLEREFEVIVDYKAPLGIELTRFMEQSIKDSDKVLLILTPLYKSKADARVAGAGYETQLITAEIYNQDRIKFIPIVKKGDFNQSYPIYLGSRNGLDMRDNMRFDINLKTLIDNL